MAKAKMFTTKFLAATFFLSALVFLVPTAKATILVNPPPPYPNIHTIGDGTTSFVITYAGGPELPTALPSGFFNSAQGYRFVNTTLVDTDTGVQANQANWVVLDVQSANTTITGSVIVMTLSLGTTCNSAIPLKAAGSVSTNTMPPICTNQGNCQGSNNVSALYTPGTFIRLAFSLDDLCTTANTAGLTVDLCTDLYANGAPAPSPSPGVTNTVPITVTVSPVNDSLTEGSVASGVVCSTANPTPTPPATIDTASFNFELSDEAPQITACPGSVTDYYFPGDTQIYLKTGNFTQDQVSDYPLSNFIVLANLSAPANPPPGGFANGANSIIQSVSINGSQQPVTGFMNSTNGSDNVYQTDVYLENQGGLISPTVPGCQQSVTSQPISGVLTESKCFIATATYHDGHAPPVMLLRKFRDDVLTQSKWGRDFIETYYRYSPALAEWAWDKPIIRSIALKLLTPIEFSAWAILKLTHADPVSNQPYIDSVKKQMAADDAAAGKTSDSSESYSEQEKKKLRPTPTPTESYSSKLKRQLNAKETAPTDTDGYTAKEKTKLPATDERESPIQLAKEKREYLHEPKREPITNAFGFKLGLSPGEQVNVTGGTVSYDQVYGSSWKPDFYLHFEHQYFHSESWGSLAGTAELGFNYASGFGQLSFPFPNDATGTTQSETVFQFIQVPFLIGLNYRFNLFKYVRPYVAASVGPLGYIELRQDPEPAKKGIAFAYSTSLGASLLLDFLDKETSKQGYETDGIQHVYLTLEYLYMNTLGGDVSIKRGGLYAGFLFEF